MRRVAVEHTLVLLKARPDYRPPPEGYPRCFVPTFSSHVTQKFSHQEDCVLLFKCLIIIVIITTLLLLLLLLLPLYIVIIIINYYYYCYYYYYYHYHYYYYFILLLRIAGIVELELLTSLETILFQLTEIKWSF